jgi:ATP-dependent helicase HrpB
VEGRGSHPAADRRSLARARRDADDLARRAGAGGEVDEDASGRVLALAYPDRLAVRRGSPGRFQLRVGTTAWIHAADPLAVERFLVAADLDGRRKDARIHLAAGIDEDDVAARFAHEVDESMSLEWEDGRLVERTERRLGGLVLSRHDRRPGPGPRVTAALLDRVRREGIAALPWPGAARELRARVGYLRERLGEPWPDLSDEALAAGVDGWLGPALERATGWDDLARVDLTRLIRGMLPYPEAADLDRLAPPRLTIPSGRSLPVDYTAGPPRIAVRVQEVFGTTETPAVAGEPVTLELLSPAGRPLQITSDLAGFWAGSWEEVRKEMAGRYPKHDWPQDPATARPSRS